MLNNLLKYLGSWVFMVKRRRKDLFLESRGENAAVESRRRDLKALLRIAHRVEAVGSIQLRACARNHSDY